MQDQGEWTIEFYEDRGSSPPREFVDRLDEQTQVRFTWSMEQLCLRNVQARPPLVRHIEGSLWELREQSRTNIYRLFYFFASGRRIVFVHGFQKKTEQTPRREIAIALRRMEQIRERDEGARGDP